MSFIDWLLIVGLVLIAAGSAHFIFGKSDANCELAQEPNCLDLIVKKNVQMAYVCAFGCTLVLIATLIEQM